jgi:hypothetical protein
MTHLLEPTTENIQMLRGAIASFINTKSTEQLVDIFIDLSCDASTSTNKTLTAMTICREPNRKSEEFSGT